MAEIDREKPAQEFPDRRWVPKLLLLILMTLCVMLAIPIDGVAYLIGWVIGLVGGALLIVYAFVWYFR